MTQSANHRTLWQNRNFARLLIGQNISIFGNAMYGLALMWSMHQITLGWSGAAFFLSLVVVAGTFPRIVFAPISGMLVDRWPKRRTLILSDILRGTGLLFLCVLTWLHWVTPWELVLFNFCLASVGTVFDPALAVLRRQAVPADQLLDANSVFQTAQKTMEILGPALGGMCIAMWGTAAAFLIDAATFLVSVGSLLGIRGIVEPEPDRSPIHLRKFIEDMAAGFRAIFSVRISRVMTPFLLFYNFAVGGVDNVLIVLFVADVLHYSAQQGAAVVGAFNTALAFGELAGSLILPRLIRRVTKERLFSTSITVTSLFIVGMGISRSISAIAVLFFLSGFFMIFLNIAFFTCIQEAVPQESLGKAWGFLAAMFTGSLSVSQLVFGSLAAVAPAGLLISLLGATGFLAGSASFLVRKETQRSPVASEHTAM